MNIFGKRLQSLRQDSDITQKDFAKILNISPRMLSYFEAGTHFPRDSQIIRAIADYFNVSTDYLFGRCDCKGNSNILTMYEKLPVHLKKEAEEYMKYPIFKSKNF